MKISILRMNYIFFIRHFLYYPNQIKQCGDLKATGGEYGDALKIVLTGTVEVVQRDPLWREGKTEHEMLQRTINSTKDREPVFGLSAVGPRNPLGPSLVAQAIVAGDLTC